MLKSKIEPHNGLAQWQKRIGETPTQLCTFLAKRACAERRSRCPTGAGGKHRSGFEQFTFLMRNQEFAQN